tara:strand:- start:239 stop:541 length:303 start_codon:yes stop_codon:yes gene_type:complete
MGFKYAIINQSPTTTQMKTEQQLAKQILSNPKAFYRLTNQKKRFGYISYRINYFSHLSITKKGDGVCITVFKAAGVPLEVSFTDVRNFCHSSNCNTYFNS